MRNPVPGGSACTPPARERQTVHAFTLIELLCALSVLGIILVMIGQVFGNSTRAWASGVGRMDQNISARAVMDLIARDLSGAILLNVSNGATSQQPRFLALGETPDTSGGERREVEYYLVATNSIYRLMRYGAQTTNLTLSAVRTGAGCVADNVTGFQVTAYGTANQMPRYIDVFFSVLNDTDAQRAAARAAPEKYEKRYTTRVYLLNQQGYSDPYP